MFEIHRVSEKNVALFIFAQKLQFIAKHWPLFVAESRPHIHSVTHGQLRNRKPPHTVRYVRQECRPKKRNLKLNRAKSLEWLQIILYCRKLEALPYFFDAIVWMYVHYFWRNCL